MYIDSIGETHRGPFGAIFLAPWQLHHIWSHSMSWLNLESHRIKQYFKLDWNQMGYNITQGRCLGILRCSINSSVIISDTFLSLNNNSNFFSEPNCLLFKFGTQNNIDIQDASTNVFDHNIRLCLYEDNSRI